MEHARDLGNSGAAASERASAELGKVQARGVWHRAWTYFPIYKLDKFLDGLHAACAPMTSKAGCLWSRAPAPIESENTLRFTSREIEARRSRGLPWGRCICVHSFCLRGGKLAQGSVGGAGLARNLRSLRFWVCCIEARAGDLFIFF